MSIVDCFFFSSRRRHTRYIGDWSSDVCSSDLEATPAQANAFLAAITELFQKLHEADGFRRRVEGMDRDARHFAADVRTLARSEERRVGKECRCRWSPEH